MNVYIYKAALLCEVCGEAERNALGMDGKKPADPRDESSYDSDDYPKGPYPDGGGEADTPQHCDTCHVFLENPLTDDGRDYATELHMERPNDVTREWAEFYGLVIPESELEA